MNVREAVRLLNVPPPPELSSCPRAGG